MAHALPGSPRLDAPRRGRRSPEYPASALPQQGHRCPCHYLSSLRRRGCAQGDSAKKAARSDRPPLAAKEAGHSCPALPGRNSVYLSNLPSFCFSGPSRRYKQIARSPPEGDSCDVMNTRNTPCSTFIFAGDHRKSSPVNSPRAIERPVQQASDSQPKP